MSKKEATTQVTQEEANIMNKILEEAQEDKGKVGFESFQHEEAAFNAAVSAMRAKTMMLYAQVPQSEAAQVNVEMIIVAQEGVADFLRKYLDRITGGMRDKLRELAQQGPDALCNYLKGVVCGALPWWSKPVCNLGFPTVCRSLFGWILQKIGLSATEAVYIPHS
jgi:hypothetical protein